MNQSELGRLKNNYNGKRIFQSKDKGYEIDLFSDIWEIGYKKYVYLDWMNTLDSELYIDLRLALAHSVKHYAGSTITGSSFILKTLCQYLEPNKFSAWWLTLTKQKRYIRDTLHVLCSRSHEYYCSTLTPLYLIVKEECIGRRDISNSILDESIGAYSEIERDNLLEAIRIETLDALDGDYNAISSFLRLRTIVSCQLLVAIVRRPSQLSQLKWCDLLRVGQTFKSQKESNLDWQPVTQHHFSDVEQLHLRTFKSKDGAYRRNAESRSHRLDPDLSELLLNYYQRYETFLCESLKQNGIVLSESEKKTLMQQLPLFPDKHLFSEQFTSKEELFNSVSLTSKGFHLSASALSSSITNLFNEKIDIKSDRVINKRLVFKNNRWRHTQLTLAARVGLSRAQIAAITGVTVGAIIPYLDLKAPERVKIDEAYAGNSVIRRFDSISAKDLQKHADFQVRSPFDEEIGYKLNPSNCGSCQAKGAAPMGCYPCDNFRPLETADHQQYLDKAERKLAINSQSGHPSTVKRLQIIVLYIKVTIALCEERKKPRLGA